MQISFFIVWANTGIFTCQPVCISDESNHQTRRHRDPIIIGKKESIAIQNSRAEITVEYLLTSYADEENTTPPMTPSSTPPTTPMRKGMMTNVTFIIFSLYVRTDGTGYRVKGDPSMAISSSLFDPTWLVLLIPLATLRQSSVIVSSGMYSSIVRVVRKQN